MRKTLHKISDFLNKCVVPVGCVIFAVLVLATVTQVVCRYFLKASATWTEELARFCFIWSTMLGSSVLVKHGGHPAVDALSRKLKGRVKAAQEIFVCLVILAVCFIGIRYGFQLVGKTVRQLSPALRIPYGYIYLSFPVGCIFSAVHLLAQLIDAVSALLHPAGDTNLPDTKEVA